MMRESIYCLDDRNELKWWERVIYQLLQCNC